MGASRFAWVLGLAVCLAVFPGCGGGGGSGSGGSSGAVFVGPISGFGSIFVNGVEFETGGTAFEIEDGPGSERDLRVGQIVEIRGTVNGDGATGRAERVRFRYELKGPVSSIDLSAGSFVVLGQSVLVGDETLFSADISPASLEGLANGDLVKVSGFVGADGGLRATRIEPAEAGEGFEVRGRVAEVDALAKTFRLRALTVDYLTATLLGFPGPDPALEDLVEVKGASVDAEGRLIAAQVKREDRDREGEDGDEAEIEGLITRFGSAGDFDVSGRAVRTTAETRFLNGTASELATDVRVEVEGSLDADGVLVAATVKFERERNVIIAAPVDSVNADAGTFVLLGITVKVDAGTFREDRSGRGSDRFSPADLRAGQYVFVRGYEDPTVPNRVIATRLERESDSGAVLLQGAVDSLDNPRFTVLGVTVDTTVSTVFEAGNETAITSEAFFAAAAGKLVKVQGTFGGGILSAGKIRLQTGDDGPSDGGGSGTETETETETD